MGRIATFSNVDRATELDDLLSAMKTLVVPFVRAVDVRLNSNSESFQNPPYNPFPTLSPQELEKHMQFDLPWDVGRGKSGLFQAIEMILKNSVNTWDQGFMDKLTSSTNAVGVVAETLLGVLNTNVHVYHVSPALTIIEKATCRRFAMLFGFSGPHAGGITCPGGSSSNLTSLVLARNAIFPETKYSGIIGHQFVIFTSEDSHFSITKAAMICGMGTANVVRVPVDELGRMDACKLRDLVEESIAAGQIPFYVNATAGTTVYGAFDPIRAISKVCKKFGLWLHVDGSWGGGLIWSDAQKTKLDGVELADSLAVNPHKLLNVPITCSFLLVQDTRKLRDANSLPADYLFHSSAGDDETWDLADLSLQCGRRADSLKLALAWIYYGPSYFSDQINHAFHVCSLLASSIHAHPDFTLVSPNPPPCLQICFYHTPGGRKAPSADENTSRTLSVVQKLLEKGFMIDYAPSREGKLVRIVLNGQTQQDTVYKLMAALKQTAYELTLPTCV